MIDLACADRRGGTGLRVLEQVGELRFRTNCDAYHPQRHEFHWRWSIPLISVAIVIAAYGTTTQRSVSILLIAALLRAA